MSVSRKEFLKKACFTGACMCGFGLPVFAQENKNNPGKNDDSPDSEKVFLQNWIANLLVNLNTDADKNDLKDILKRNAEIHFNELKMNEMLSEYIGHLDNFILFISEKWGWKIEYDKTNKTIIANENKTYCVCPVMKQENAIKTSVICNCSEGFAEKLFSLVLAAPVKAMVISSVLRGDESCIYKNNPELTKCQIISHDLRNN